MPKKAATPAVKAPRSRSDSHKEALAVGRDQGRVVRLYLEALEANKPRRGRKRTAEGIQKRLAAIDERIAAADALSRLHLAQERMDLEAELAASAEGGVDVQALESEVRPSRRSVQPPQGHQLRRMANCWRGAPSAEGRRHIAKLTSPAARSGARRRSGRFTVRRVSRTTRP